MTNKDHNTHRLKDAEQNLSGKEQQIVHSLVDKRQRVFDRFPLLLTMLGSFGLVATFYGFERLIDEIDIFSNNPIILLTVGVATLLLTGTLYSKL